MSKIFVVGFGPGNEAFISAKAKEVLNEADCIIGYTTYIKLLKQYLPDKEYLDTPMKKEIDRCELALKIAEEGKTVALVSSGDAGVYGMAGIMYEVAFKNQANIPIEVIPGITAATAAAALLGAPLMHDFCLISFSDLMTDPEKILKRVELAIEADFIMCIYNPRSKTRTELPDKAFEIIRSHTSPDRPIGIVRNAGREEQTVQIMKMSEFKSDILDMFSIVIVGNSQTYICNDKMITPRGYYQKNR